MKEAVTLLYGLPKKPAKFPSYPSYVQRLFHRPWNKDLNIDRLLRGWIVEILVIWWNLNPIKNNLHDLGAIANFQEPLCHSLDPWMIFIARFSVEWNDLGNLIVTMAMPSYMKDGFSKKWKLIIAVFLVKYRGSMYGKFIRDTLPREVNRPTKPKNWLLDQRRNSTNTCCLNGDDITDMTSVCIWHSMKMGFLCSWHKGSSFVIGASGG